MAHKQRRMILALAALLVIGAGCRFAARMPAVITGTEPLRLPAASEGDDSLATMVAELLTPGPGENEPNAVQTPAPEEPFPLPATIPAPNGTGAIILGEETLAESGEKPIFDIKARYPVLGWDDRRAEAFNEAAESIALGEIRAFKEHVYKVPDDSAFSEWPSFLEIDFTPTASEKGILSVLFGLDYYSAGAAHPGHYSIALNYDLESGKVIELGDLFEEDAPYLDALSGFCLDDLEKRGHLGWEDGALPKAENYQVWNVTASGLMITFDEYQVASYAEGRQTVIVPYDVLRPLLLPGGPLESYLDE